MLHHADIWRAIDRLAERHGLSASGLARKAGLSATLFNPSKRASGKRKRWPSTESIAAILKATGSSLDDFVALASTEAQQHHSLPLLGSTDIKKLNPFDANGHPTQEGWDKINLPGANDPHAYALEVLGPNLEPAYRDGDRLIVSPAEKPRRGDRVVLRTAQGEILVKQLGREGAQKIEFLSFGGEEAPLTLPRGDIDWFHRIVWASQ